MPGIVLNEAIRWFPWTPSGPDAKPVMYCFPYAGAGAAIYRPWMLCRGGERIGICPVELPGRGTRRAEPPFDDMTRLVAKLLPVLVEHSGGRAVALFGHSVGGLVAARMAGELVQAGVTVEHVFVSAVAGLGADTHSRLFRSMAADELMHQLTLLGGTPPELLETSTFLSDMLPRLRADLALRDSAGIVPISAPLTAFSGARDRIATPAMVETWRALTTDRFAHHRFPDGHFFLRERRDEILALVDQTLGTALVPEGALP